MNKQIKADISLLLVTLGWGISFILTKDTLDFMKPFNFIGIRFLTAFFLSAIFFFKRFKDLDKKTFKHALILGTVLFIGYLFQTIGIQYTTVTNSGFITGFSVVIVPIIAIFLLKHKPEKSAILGTILAIIGLSLMSIKPGFKINIGDTLTLISAFAFATHIILTGEFSKEGKPILIGVIQIGVVGFLGLFSTIFEGGFIIPTEIIVWKNILFLAIVCTAAAFIIQTVAQKYTTATHTALIYITEPVFAAMFAYILINEKLDTQAIFGAALILIGMFNAEVFPNLKKYYINKKIKKI
ncbi:DMT family transporter [Clostridiaceae bacterium HSG29]|nr:DMT family transporter [Clostridiaceae bacterium HSG29]